MVEKNLNLLEQNLIKKNELLVSLQGLFEKQSTLLDDIDMESADFDECMEEQDSLMEELIQLNEEADVIYQQLCSEEILSNGVYAVQTEKIRTLLSDMREKVERLQPMEQANKKKLEFYFQDARKNLGVGRRSSKAALDYYKSMNRSNVIPPQFMDQKK